DAVVHEDGDLVLAVQDEDVPPKDPQLLAPLIEDASGKRFDEAAIQLDGRLTEALVARQQVCGMSHSPASRLNGSRKPAQPLPHDLFHLRRPYLSPSQRSPALCLFHHILLKGA